MFCWQFYDVNGDGYIDFNEFIKGLSVLVKGSQEEKIVCKYYRFDALSTLKDVNILLQ